MPVDPQHGEEFEPRQAPKASSYFQTTPVPSVPDVSLVFDSNAKSKDEDLPRSDRYHSQPVSYERMKKYDDNEPRTSKPTPVAPLPNESYAAWRARALRTHCERSSGNTALRGIMDVHRDIAESAVNPSSYRGMNEVPGLAVHESISHQSHLAASRGTLSVSTSVTRSKSSSEQPSYNVRFLEPSESNNEFTRNVEAKDHQCYSKSVAYKPVRPRENPTLRRENSRDSVTQGDFGDEISFEYGRKISSSDTKGRRKNEGKNPSGNREYCSPSSFPRESPKQEKSEKRDSLRDIYRIIQLQNEQIQSLQSQVEKLLLKTVDDAKRSELPKPVKKDACIQCVEEGTQTIALQVRNASVGVMTSFVDMDSQSDKDCMKGKVKATNCQCESCSSPERNENPPKGRKTNKVSRGSTQKPVSSNGSPIHQCNKMAPNMQLIAEESDECSSSSDSECVTPVNSDARAKNDRNCKVTRNRTKDANGRQSDQEKIGSHSPKNKENMCTTPKSTGNLRNRQKGLANRRHAPRHEDLNRDKCHLVNAPRPKERNNVEDDVTMTLNGVELPTVRDPHISPEPSIHVDMQDYQEFSEDGEDSSDDEGGYSSGNESNGSNKKESQKDKQPNMKPSSEQGDPTSDSQGSWTFYDNVLGQVNKLLRNQNVKSSSNETPNVRQNADEVRNQLQNARVQQGNALLTVDAVREATIQHLRQMGIDIPYNNGYNPPMPHIPVQNTVQPQRMGPMDSYGFAGRNLRERPPSERSLRMNALAMKYLSNEELASFEHLGARRDTFQPEPPQFASEQPLPRMGGGVIGEVSSADFTLYGMNGTNLSFTTLRYLQRYQLTPANGNNPQGMWRNQPQYGNFPDASNPNGMHYAQTSPNHGEGSLPFHRDNPGMNPYRQSMDNNLVKQTHANREPLPSNIPQSNVQRAMQCAGDKVNPVGSDRMKDVATPPAMKARRTRARYPVDQPPRNDGEGMTAKGHPNPNGFRNAGNLAVDFGALRESRTQSSNILDIEALRQQRKLL